MKKILETTGFLITVFGVCGVIRELTDDWFRFMGITRHLTDHIWFLEDRALFANIVFAVLGLVLMIVSDRVRKS
ncbi:hypothetical protein ACGFMM_26325 [Streptomyces sp. NPDC048604]|uniref:hypothetical protein n=1 Tax=Streptomyces sp. NPDC048604 TaxID=3365578 RepID=UPI00371B95E8